MPLAGTGVLLGAALVAALGGCLLLVAQRLAGDGGAPGRRAGPRWGWPSCWREPASCSRSSGWRLSPAKWKAPLAWRWPASRAPSAVLAGSLFATRPGAPPFVSRLVALALPLAALVAVALAIALAVSGVLGDGTYATPAAASAAATALLGLSALETTGAPGLRRFAFLLALLALAIPADDGLDAMIAPSRARRDGRTRCPTTFPSSLRSTSTGAPSTATR